MKLILSILFVVVSQHFIGQEINDLSRTFHIKQDGVAINFSVQDVDSKPIKRYNQELFYYWYKAQKVMKTQGGSAGELLHGKYQSFYTNSQLCEQGEFYKGQKDNVWSYWNSKGNLIKVENWNKGVQTGDQLKFNENGHLEKRMSINTKSNQNNLADTVIEINKNDTKISCYDSIGNVVSIKRLKSNLLHGKQESIDSDGKKTTVIYKNGELVQQKAKMEKKEPKTDKTKEDNKIDRFKKKIQFWKREKKEPLLPENPEKEKRKLFKKKKND